MGLAQPILGPPKFEPHKMMPSWRALTSVHGLPTWPCRLTGPRFRQSSRFLPCSPGPCALPDYSPSTARVHEDHGEASRPPFCGTQLAEICGVDRPRNEGDRGAPRLSAPYNSAQLGPPGLEGITPPRRRGAPGGKTCQEEAYSAQLRTFILRRTHVWAQQTKRVKACKR